MPKTSSASRSNAQSLLTTLKLTTTIGAVSLTLAGWGLLSGVEAYSGTQTAETASLAVNGDGSVPLAIIGEDAGAELKVGATASIEPSSTAAAVSRALPTPTTAVPTVAAPTPAPAPETKFKLDIVQWVQTRAGDPVAIVRDNTGILWYVWGADVPLIEQGLAPQFQPQPVNAVTRSRRS